MNEMNLLELMTIDLGFDLYMAKRIRQESRDSIEQKGGYDALHPKTEQLNYVIMKMMPRVERNYAPAQLPNGDYNNEASWDKGLLRGNYESIVALSEFCADHVKDLRIPPKYVHAFYQIVMDSRKQFDTKGERIKHHIVPHMQEGVTFEDFLEGADKRQQDAVFDWIDNRAKFILMSCFSQMRQNSVSVPPLKEIELSTWEELAYAEFNNTDTKNDIAMSEDGGEIVKFSEISKEDLEAELARMEGDEHATLTLENFDGTYYLPETADIELVENCQRVIRGYWDLLNHVQGNKANVVRQSILDDIRTAMDELQSRKGDTASNMAGIPMIL